MEGPFINEKGPKALGRRLFGRLFDSVFRKVDRYQGSFQMGRGPKFSVLETCKLGKPPFGDPFKAGVLASRLIVEISPGQGDAIFGVGKLRG